MRKGEPGADYVLIAAGEVEVTDDGRLLQVCEAGEGVGEIALLHRVPRTATVKARTPVEGYSIDADAFLTAVAGPTCAAMAHAVAEARLERSRELEAAGV
jgi:CRP-like cAMP-binding protein